MKTFIDFYADWCGPCKRMEPIFEEVKKEYAGKIEFKKIDVEQEGATAAKFGIMGIPTFVIMDGDTEISRKSGAMAKETLVNWLNSNLA